MTKLWAISLCTLWLGLGWSGCAGSPMSERDDGGEDGTRTPPDVVVIGSKQDDSGAGESDASSARPEAGSALPPADGGAKPKDAAVVDAGAGSTADGPKLPSDAGERDARTPADPLDAGAPDSGVAPVIDASAPPERPDAGQPVAPDAGKTGCLPGTYKGSFQGEISALLGLVRIDVAGDITIQVELAETNGDRLKIGVGVLQGTDTSDQKNPLFARIGGVLNCATKKLENGTISDGTYNRVDPLYPFNGPTTTTFSGTIGGVYSTNPPAAVGTWMVTNGSGTRTSMGTWNAALQ